LKIYYNDRNNYDETKYKYESLGTFYEGFNVTDLDLNKSGLILKESNYNFENHILNYGLEINEDKVVDNTQDIDNNKENTNKAFFIQDNFSFDNKNTIILGARYDDNENFGSRFSPRLGYIYEINNNFNFNLSAGESYRIPTFLDLYGMGGNEDLEPEESRNYDIGFKYRDTVCKREFSLFRRDYSNLIAYDNVANKVKNIKSATVNGFELITNREINNKWELGFSYTYLDAEDDDSGEQLTDMPYHDLNLNVSYLLKDGKITLFNRYLGERKDYLGESPSHFVSDLKVSNNLTENTKLSVEVNNIFNEEYEVVIGYPMPGRNFMVNVSTKF